METVTSELLRIERNAELAILTLNRPNQRNAMSLELMNRLIVAFDELRDDPDVRVVILGAAGPAFCAGHDLGEMLGLDLDGYRAVFATCTRMMTAIHELPQPVIASVQGIATAAGCQLVAACDLAVCSSSAKFATPGVKIGLFCSTPMVALSRVVSRKAAMEMLLTGELIDAHRAREIGLVNRVVADIDLDAAVLALARQIAGKSPLTLAIGKEAFYRQIELDLAAAYALTAGVMTSNMLAHDAEEGIDAFLEKRPAVWSGT